MGATYLNFSTGVFHVDGEAPLTQEQVDSVWFHLPTTAAGWVERGRLFVQQFDGAKVFDLGPVERGVKGVSDEVRLGGYKKRHHSTKKSGAELDREIAETLSQRPATSSHVQRPAQSLGHLSWLDRGTKEAYEHDGQVYIAPASARIDPEGYRYGGRWTLSLPHWKRGQQERAREIAQALVARRSRGAHATKRLTTKTTVRGLRDGQYTAGTGLLIRKIKALGAKVTLAATGRVTAVDKGGTRHVYVLVADPSITNSPLAQALADLESAT